LSASLVVSGIWVAVESFTVLGAGFGTGPLVAVVANDHGVADVHTQRFAALLGAFLLLNVYSIGSVLLCKHKGNNETMALFHTVLVGDALAIALCGIVEALHGDWVAIVWHAVLGIVFAWLLIVKKDDWRSLGPTAMNNPKES
jgi:hypothetical protein